MSKRSAIRNHVRTNLGARIVYRIICIALIALGIFGLCAAFVAGEYAIQYSLRDSETTATVTDKTSSTDKYGYETCDIKYTFTVNDKQFTTESVLSSNYNCQVDPDQQITIRYQANNPGNNAYGDNEDDENMRTVIATSLTLASMIPLGIGFVGLVAIHKAMQAEDEAEELAEAKARRRTYRRRLKKEAKTDTDERE